MKRTKTGLLVFVLLAGTALSLYSSSGLYLPETKKAIVEVKYISAARVHNILIPYTSREGRIQVLRERNILIIEDIPEVVEKLLSIIKGIDVKPLDLQFTVDLILGSLSLESQREPMINELRSDPVIIELQKLLKYRSFTRLDSSIIKVQDNKYSTQRMGGENISLLLRMTPRLIKEEKANTFQVELRLSQRQGISEGKEISSTLIDTTLSLKSGERTVVGVSRLDGGDKALILILSGKVIQ